MVLTPLVSTDFSTAIPPPQTCWMQLGGTRTDMVVSQKVKTCEDRSFEGPFAPSELEWLMALLATNDTLKA